MEVLVTLVVMAFGRLGIAGLQSRLRALWPDRCSICANGA